MRNAACPRSTSGDSRGTGRGRPTARRQVVVGLVPYEGDTPQPLSSSETQEVCHREPSPCQAGAPTQTVSLRLLETEIRTVGGLGRRRVVFAAQRTRQQRGATHETAWSPGIEKKVPAAPQKSKPQEYQALQNICLLPCRETVRLRRAQTHYKMQSSSCSQSNALSVVERTILSVKFLPNILDKLFQKAEMTQDSTTQLQASVRAERLS